MYTVKEIAQITNGVIEGDENFLIKGICDLEIGKKGYLSYLKNSSYDKYLNSSKASVILINKKNSIENNSNKIFIKVDNAALSFIKILNKIKKEQLESNESNNFIGKDAIIEKSVNLGHNLKINKNVIINCNSYIGSNSQIGENTIIHANVVICENISIGKNCVIHSGTVIGSEGFGLIKEKNINYNIPHLGKVIIGDDVTIGANCCIDRGTINNTVIGDNCKLDNLIQVGHNVKIGDHCVIAAQVGIGGSTVIEDNVTIAGQVGIIDHIKIEENSTILVKALVCNSVPSNSVISGIPAINHRQKLRQYAALKKLPKIIKNL